MPTSDIPPEAIQVLQTFLDAGLKSDIATMRTCLTRQTLEAGQFDGNSPQGVRFVLGDGTIEGNFILIPVKAYPLDAPADSPPAMEMPCLLIQEEGHWKFDLIATTERMFSGGIDAALSQTAEALGTAMQGITEALGDTLSQAFGDSSEESEPPQNWLEAPLDYLPEELFPLAEFAPFPKVSATLSDACGSPVLAMGAITDLLRSLGSDERDTLLNWFDNQLFEGIGPIFSSLNASLPLTNRLRAFRIEPAKHTEHRMLILDGSDLVYRMFLHTVDGYYSDDQIADLLPGILAGLPDSPDPQVTGHRLIHTDEEPSDIELYKTRVAPRFMRRISELLGKNISFKANWDDIFSPKDDSRLIYRWGLNRIYGALALACHDRKRHKQLSEELTGIHLIFATNSVDRFARFADGILTVSLDYFRGEVGCFYERDLERVLAGHDISYTDPDAPPSNSEDASAADPAEIDSEPLKAQALNDENFRTAAISLKENEPTWAMQLEMVFQRPISLSLNFDSLNGDYQLVQPFIHQGLTATLEALTQIAFDPNCKPLADRIQSVTISGATADHPVSVTFSDSALFVVPLQLGDVRPPTPAIINALRTLATENPQGPTTIAVETSTDSHLIYHPTGATTQQPAHSHEVAAPLYQGDPYQAAAQFIADLEAALRETELWPGPKPDGEIEVKGAFGCENMPFERWLAWILIPRIQDIINTQGSFPHSSSLAPYAVRALDGAYSGNIIQHLAAFDDMINSRG